MDTCRGGRDDNGCCYRRFLWLFITISTRVLEYSSTMTYELRFKIKDSLLVRMVVGASESRATRLDTPPTVGTTPLLPLGRSCPGSSWV